MANTCENTLEVTGDKEEITRFLANVFEVEEGGVEYKIPNSDDILPFGWLQNRDDNSITFSTHR